jgi:hypothetical protein
MTRRPSEPGTEELAHLPVDELPPDAPERGSAAVDDEPDRRPDPEATAHDPDAERGPVAVMSAYAAALADGSAAAAADLFAENGAVLTEDGRRAGRDEVLDWHRKFLDAGGLRARPAGQGTDTGRLEVDGPLGRRVVELAFDASGRIGSARWLTPSAQAASEEERIRRGL